MNYPTAIVIAAALIAGAIATTGARSADHEPAFDIVADAQSRGAWRINTRTGAVSACGLRGADSGCYPIEDKQRPR